MSRAIPTAQRLRFVHWFSEESPGTCQTKCWRRGRDSNMASNFTDSLNYSSALLEFPHSLPHPDVASLLVSLHQHTPSAPRLSCRTDADPG